MQRGPDCRASLFTPRSLHGGASASAGPPERERRQDARRSEPEGVSRGPDFFRVWWFSALTSRSAALGLAALPVLFDSLTSLKADGFEATKYYMDQFVALAILACFAIGQYVTGTIVAAILIVGQILEERTTLGVEEAVKSLTRLARVKARRVRSTQPSVSQRSVLNSQLSSSAAA